MAGRQGGSARWVVQTARSRLAVARRVPLERLLIETDAPYLAPVPFRGKRNQPAYVPHVAAEIARLRGISIEDVGAATTANFFRLFGIDATEVRHDH